MQVSVLIDAAARKKKLKLSKWQLELLLGLNKGKVIKKTIRKSLQAVVKYHRP